MYANGVVYSLLSAEKKQPHTHRHTQKHMSEINKKIHMKRAEEEKTHFYTQREGETSSTKWNNKHTESASN